MKLSEKELKELYQQQTTRSNRGEANCLSEQELLRAATGELSQSERERVADHLVVCSDCAREYSIASSLKPWSEQFGKTERKQKIFFPSSVSYAIAASLLLLCLALTGWIISLREQNHRATESLNQQLAERDRALAAAKESLAETRRQLEGGSGRSEQYEKQIAEQNQIIAELSQPQINVPINDLDPKASIRGSQAGITTVKVPPGANLFTLILNTTDEQSFPNYGLEILDQSGKLIWSGDRLRKTESNNFTVALTRRLFPVGQYRIKLYGLREGRKKLIEDYSLRIQY